MNDSEYIIPENEIFTGTRAITRTIAAVENNIRLILHQGGTGSGKTYGILYAIIQIALTFSNWTVSITAKNFPHLKRGAMRQFKEILVKTELYDRAVIENRNDHTFTFKENGTIVEFLAIDTVEKAHGPKRNMIFINEANHTAYQIYRQLSLRSSFVILDWNPSALFWLHSKVLPGLKPNEYLLTITTYLDNPAADEKMIRELEAMKETDPENYEVYALGKTGKPQGLVFKDIYIVDEFPIDCEKVGYGLDFGFTNANTACVKFGVKGDNIYLHELIYELDINTDQIITRLDNSEIDEDDDLVCDPQKQEILDEIAAAGYNVIRGGKGQGSIIAGIDLLKKYKLHITKDSINFIIEANNYCWKETIQGKVLNKPIDEYNDLWDATRYIAQYKLRGKKSKRPFVFKSRKPKSIGLKNL